MVHGVLHRFQAHGEAQGGIDRARAVARRQHSFVFGPAVLVGQDAVVFTKTALAGQVRRREHADAHHHGIGGERAIARFDRLDAPAPRETPDLLPHPNAHAGLPVQAGEPIGNGGAGHAAHYPLLGLQDGDFGACLRRRGRHFQPYVPSAHNDNPPSRSKFLVQRVGVVQRPQIVDAGQIRARRIELAQNASGGQHQAVVAELLAVVQHRKLVAAVHGQHPAAQAQFHVPGLVVLRPAKQQPLALEFAGQVLLGKRRALIGRRALLADQRYRPAMAAEPKRDDQLGRGLAAADDQHRFARHYETAGCSGQNIGSSSITMTNTSSVSGMPARI